MVIIDAGDRTNVATYKIACMLVLNRIFDTMPNDMYRIWNAEEQDELLLILQEGHEIELSEPARNAFAGLRPEVFIEKVDMLIQEEYDKSKRRREKLSLDGWRRVGYNDTRPTEVG